MYLVCIEVKVCINTCETCGKVGCPHTYELLPHGHVGSGLGHDLSEVCCPKNNDEL